MERRMVWLGRWGNDQQVPVFTRESSFLQLIGSFEGPEDLAERHDRYVAGGVRRGLPAVRLARPGPP